MVLLFCLSCGRGVGDTHKHARMHAHVHTPHVWGCSQGPEEELHDCELLDVSAGDGTWVLCKSRRHSYWLSHDLPSPIIFVSVPSPVWLTVLLRVLCRDVPLQLEASFLLF